MTCTVEDCTTKARTKGLCHKHYERLRRRGTLETRPPIDNLARYTILAGGCWRWDGPLLGNGYGQTSTQIHGTTLAHRAFYIEHRGPVADVLDHLCRNRWCVNPDHLEPVTTTTNIQRGAVGYGARNTCRSGLHDITNPANVYSPPGDPLRRTCYPCARANWARARAKRREARQARERNQT